MGSLALAGAIGGFGQGMQANVVRENVNEQANLNRMHDERLATMRNEAATSLQESGQEFTAAQQTSSQEFSAGQAELENKQRVEAAGLLHEQGVTALEGERAFQTEVATTAAARDDFVREDEQEQERYIEAMKQWTALTESGSVTSADNKWEMQLITETVTDPATGLPMEQDRLVVREPGTPGSYVQHNMVMVPDNSSEEEIAKALDLYQREDLRAPMDDLLQRIGTDEDNSSEFLEAYGFLPFRYFRELRTKTQGSAGAFQTFYRRFIHHFPIQYCAFA